MVGFSTDQIETLKEFAAPIPYYLRDRFFNHIAGRSQNPNSVFRGAPPCEDRRQRATAVAMASFTDARRVRTRQEMRSQPGASLCAVPLCARGGRRDRRNS